MKISKDNAEKEFPVFFPTTLKKVTLPNVVKKIDVRRQWKQNDLLGTNIVHISVIL